MQLDKHHQELERMKEESHKYREKVRIREMKENKGE